MQVAVREHRALAAPRGPAGVEDGCQLVGALRLDLMHVPLMGSTLQQGPAAVLVERENMLRAGPKGDLAEPADVLAGAYQHGRFGVSDEIRHLGALVGGVQRQGAAIYE